MFRPDGVASGAALRAIDRQLCALVLAAALGAPPTASADATAATDSSAPPPGSPSSACPGEYPPDVDPTVTLTRCEAAARSAKGAASAPLLLAFGRLCGAFTVRCTSPRCIAFMAGRSDLFENVDIHGWLCRTSAIHDEVVARFPGTPAADDAAWELALELRGECESFVDCELENALAPLLRYRARSPTGRHVPHGVARAVNALQTRLGYPLTPGAQVDGTSPIPRILRQYEAAAADLPRELRARMLRAVAPWWERLGEGSRARELVTEANRLDAE